MTHQALKFNLEMHFLYFYNAADGWWQEEHPRVFGSC